MGFFDFLKGEKSSRSSKGKSSKTKTSSGTIWRTLTRAERSKINKKRWSEKQAEERKNRSSSSVRRSAKYEGKNQTSSPSQRERKLTRAERSIANKQAWAEKTATEKSEPIKAKSDDSTTSSKRPRSSRTEKLTKKERSAINKMAWAEKSAREKADRAPERLRPAKTGKPSSISAGGMQPRPKSVSGSSSSPAKKLTRAERSVINKENHRRQRELEAKAASTGSGFRKRRDVFETREQYEKYLRSEEWKKTREHVQDRSGRRCERCGKGGAQVHHLRYSSPGQEHISHLMYVCNACHREIHRTKR